MCEGIRGRPLPLGRAAAGECPEPPASQRCAAAKGAAYLVHAVTRLGKPLDQRDDVFAPQTPSTCEAK